MQLKLTLFAIILATSYKTQAQEIIWPEYKVTEIPDSLGNEDAVYLQNIFTMGFNNVGQTDLNYFKRIYILSDQEAEALGTQHFYLGENTNLIRLGGRIIKDDGKIINLSDTERFKSYELVKDEYTNEIKRKYIVKFPDIVAGDVIDLMYDVKIDQYLLSNTLYLEGEYPSLYSRITLRNMSTMDLTANAMNTTIQPVSKIKDGILTLTWERTGVKKMYEHYFHAPTPDQPALIYSMWNRGTTLEYSSVYYYDDFSYPHDFTSFSPIGRNFAEQGIYSMEDPVTVRIQKLITHFDKNFKFVPKLSVEPASKVTTHIMEKEMSEAVFFTVIQKMLNENNVKFWIGYSQSLLNGPFFNGVVSLSQLDTRFLMIQMENGEEHFLFGPDNGRFYYLDEIPWYIEGNKAVGMTGEKGTLDELAGLQLPESSKLENTHFVKILLKKEGETITARRDDHLTGHFSTITRGPSQSTWLHKFGLEQKTIDHSTQKMVYPYDLDLISTTVDHWKLIPSGDTLTTFTLKDVLAKNIYDTDEETVEQMAGYMVLPFEKSVKYSIYYQSDKNIMLRKPADIKLSNSVGEIILKSTVMNNSILSISINLTINDRYVQGEGKIAEYRALLDQWMKIVQMEYGFSETVVKVE